MVDGGRGWASDFDSTPTPGHEWSREGLWTGTFPSLPRLLGPKVLYGPLSRVPPRSTPVRPHYCRRPLWVSMRDGFRRREGIPVKRDLQRWTTRRSRIVVPRLTCREGPKTSLPVFPCVHYPTLGPCQSPVKNSFA